jgi:hypothetical protein
VAVVQAPGCWRTAGAIYLSDAHSIPIHLVFVYIFVIYYLQM